MLLSCFYELKLSITAAEKSFSHCQLEAIIESFIEGSLIFDVLYCPLFPSSR